MVRDARTTIGYTQYWVARVAMMAPLNRGDKGDRGGGDNKGDDDDDGDDGGGWDG